MPKGQRGFTMNTTTATTEFVFSFDAVDNEGKLYVVPAGTTVMIPEYLVERAQRSSIDADLAAA